MRAKGRRRFILEDGILQLGGLYAILSTVSGYLFKHGFSLSKVSEYLWSGETIFKFFFGWLGFGFLMGAFVWYFTEREFGKQGKDET